MIGYSKIPLNSHNLSYYGEDQHLFDCIVRTVQKLPDQVAHFAIDRCRFLSVGRSCWGMTMPAYIATHNVEKRTRNIWLILLEELIPDDEIDSAIAHEIAHAWLKHDRMGDFPEDGEIAAANLTRRWGFSGKGTDPEYCNR